MTRYLFFGLLLLMLSCHGRQHSNQQASIDTTSKPAPMLGSDQPEGPIVVQNPTSVATKINRTTPDYLNIEVAASEYQVSFLNKNTIFRSGEQLEKFVHDNKSKIHNEKIAISVNGNIPYKDVKPVVEILKRNNFTKFNLLIK